MLMVCMVVQIWGVYFCHESTKTRNATKNTLPLDSQFEPYCYLFPSKETGVPFGHLKLVGRGRVSCFSAFMFFNLNSLISNLVSKTY